MDAGRLVVGRPFNWKVFVLILIGAIVGVVGIIPYSLTLQADTITSAAAEAGLTVPQALAINMVSSIVLIGLLTAAGYFFATRIGFGLPYIEAWLDPETETPADLGKNLITGLAAGVIFGLLIIALDLYAFGPSMQALVTELGIVVPGGSLNPPAWQGFLASFYGGITEEVQLRLFLMTGLAWLGSLISKDDDGRPTTGIVWMAIIIAAILFGLGHLPATAAIGLPLNGLVIARALVLNGIVAVVFGWLYWTRGLETAIVAHFTADIVLHVIFPLLEPLLG